MFKRLIFLNMNVISSFLIAASAFGVKYDPQDRFIKKKKKSYKGAVDHGSDDLGNNFSKT